MDWFIFSFPGGRDVWDPSDNVNKENDIMTQPLFKHSNNMWNIAVNFWQLVRNTSHFIVKNWWKVQRTRNIFTVKLTRVLHIHMTTCINTGSEGCNGRFSKGHSHVLNSIETSVLQFWSLWTSSADLLVPTVSASSKPYTLLLIAAHRFVSVQNENSLQYSFHCNLQCVTGHFMHLRWSCTETSSMCSI